MANEPTTCDLTSGVIGASTWGADGGELMPAPAPAEKAALSTYGRLWASGQEGSLADDLCEPASPYEQSLWVYRCLSEIQKCAGGIPLQLARQGDGLTVRRKSWRAEIRRSKARSLRAVAGCKAVAAGRAADGEEITAGEAVDILNRPNTYQDWPAFFGALIGYYYLRGSVAIVLTGMEGRGNRPTEMHVVDGRYVEPQWARDEGEMPFLIGYIYRAPKSRTEIALGLDECKYFASWAPHASDPLQGLSVLGPGRLSVASEYNASLYNASALANGGEPGVVAVLPGHLTDEQRDQFRANWRDRFVGPAKAKRLFIMEGGGEVKPFSQSFRDMEFDTGKRTTRLEICCLFGVPPVVAGWVDAAGDSSAYTANALRQFYQQTIFPLLDLFCPAIQEIVSRFEPSAVVYFHVEDQPVVQEMRLARLDAATKLAGLGYPANMINAKLDLGMDETPWGDVGLLPAGLLPATDVVEGIVFPPVAEGPPPEEQDSPAEDAEDAEHTEIDPLRSSLRAPRSPRASLPASLPGLERVWKRFAASWNPLAKLTSKPILRFIGHVQTRALKALRRNSEPGTSAGRCAGNRERGRRDESVPGSEFPVPGSSTVQSILFEAIEGASPQERLAFRLRMVHFVSDANELGIRQALIEAGLSGERLDEAVRRLMSNPAITDAIRSGAVRLTSRVRGRLATQLRRSLTEGVAAGEDVRKLADRIQAVSGASRRMAIHQARDAVGQAMSEARNAGHLAGGMTHKGWLHSRGPGERRANHIMAEVRYLLNPIPIDEMFLVGRARLRFPRDAAAGSPEETVGCQCLQIASRAMHGAAPTAAELAIAYLGREFLGYAELLAGRHRTSVVPSTEAITNAH